MVPTRDAHADRLALALRQGAQRKWLEMTARRAYATDLNTGLPNHAQLMEHMTHLLALREREPAPMALLALRIEGPRGSGGQARRRGGQRAARKIAVRLRSGLRASDVVAAIGADRFAVLLAWIDEVPTTAIAWSPSCRRACSGRSTWPDTISWWPWAAGVARYPGDGRDADTLLRLAASQASQNNAQGRAGFFNRIERGDSAANDEVPSQL